MISTLTTVTELLAWQNFIILTAKTSLCELINREDRTGDRGRDKEDEEDDSSGITTSSDLSPRYY